MKKAFAAVFIILMLSGCAGKKNAEVKDVLKGGFEASFSYANSGQEFSGKVSRGIDGDFKITVLSPKSLENTVFYYKNGKTEISFDGFIRYDIGSSLPETSVVGLICKPIETAILNNLSEGKIGETEYKVTVEDGCLAEIRCGEVSVKITNFVKT